MDTGMLKSAAAATLAACASIGCVDIVAIDGPRYVEREERRFRVEGRPTLVLDTFDGAIEIRPWDRPEVMVVVEKRAMDQQAASTIEIRTEHEGPRIRLVARVRDGLREFPGSARSASLIVSVPASVDLNARTGDGAIDVEQVAGTVTLRSGDGSLRVRSLRGELHAETVDGALSLRDLDGVLDGHTGDGSIDVEGTFSRLRLHTGDGSIRVQAAEGSAPAADWDISTGDGSVIVAIPEAFDAALDARTGDGRVHLNDVAIADVRGRLGRNSLRGQLGAGGPALRIRSGDGSITLRRF